MINRLKFQGSIFSKLVECISLNAFKNSSAVFADYTMAGGQIPKLIEEKFNLYGNNNKISKQVIGYGDNQLAVNYAIRKHNLKGTYTVKTDSMLECDYALINPPYKDGEWIKHFNTAFKMTKKQLICIAPAYELLNQKFTKKDSIVKEFFDNLNGTNGYLDYIHIIDGNLWFDDMDFASILHIISVFKEKQHDFINVATDVYPGGFDGKPKLYKINNINELSLDAYYPGYQRLKKNILQLCKVDNVDNHLYYANDKNHILPTNGYFVRVPKIRAGINHRLKIDNDKYAYMYKSTFWTTHTKGLLPTKISNMEENNFWFQTYNEALNFIHFLELTSTRYALSLFKLNRNLHRGEFGSIPWLDFKKTYTNEDIFKLINATQDDIKFIKEKIESYYE
jgi:hypothetical protein